MAARQNNSNAKHRLRAPALDPEAREQQMMALAMDVAEEQMINRTASSQVITHFLKLATMKTELEKEKLRKENILLEAKTEAIKSAARTEELYINALNAMKSYNGGSEDEDEPE